MAQCVELAASDVAAVRRALGMARGQLAAVLHVDGSTVRAWERAGGRAKVYGVGAVVMRRIGGCTRAAAADAGRATVAALNDEGPVRALAVLLDSCASMLGAAA